MAESRGCDLRNRVSLRGGEPMLGDREREMDDRNKAPFLSFQPITVRDRPRRHDSDRSMAGAQCLDFPFRVRIAIASSAGPGSSSLASHKCMASPIILHPHAELAMNQHISRSRRAPRNDRSFYVAVMTCRLRQQKAGLLLRPKWTGFDGIAGSTK